MNCCAIREIDGIIGETPAEVVEFVRNDMFSDGNKCAYYVFSDAINKEGSRTVFKYGSALARYINRNRLGTIGTLPARRNPNTGNLVKVWTWGVDGKRLGNWKSK